MLALHERIQRRLCRVAFLGLCLLPTCGVLLWAVWRHTPWYVRTCQTSLGTQFGLRVSLGHVSHPRPGSAVYRGLQLAEPENGLTLLLADQMRCEHTPEAEIWVTPEIDLKVTALVPIWESLSLQLRSPAPSKVRWVARSVRVGNQPLLTDVRGRLEPCELGTQLSLSFRIAGADRSAPARLHIVRNRQTMPPTMSFKLVAGNTPLPCSLLGKFLPAWEHLGPDSTFRGLVWAKQGQTGWDGELAGEFTGVDLQSLVSGQYPHWLSGRAHIVLRWARFQQGRVQLVSGNFAAGPGLIGPSLCNAAVDAFDLIHMNLPIAGNDPISYQQLAFNFEIDTRGMTIRGACQDTPRGTVLMTRSAVILGEPRNQPVPTVALVKMLVPSSGVWIPAAREADSLTRFLPLPSSTSPPTANEIGRVDGPKVQ